MHQILLTYVRFAYLLDMTTMCLMWGCLMLLRAYKDCQSSKSANTFICMNRDIIKYDSD
jgi:hypothetical protein